MSKRRRTVSPPPLSVSYLLRYRLHVTPQGAPQAVEKPVPGGVDATHPGANADDQLAENPVVLEQLDNPAIARESTESEVGMRKRVMPEARRLVSLSPYQTRARSRLHAVDPLEPPRDWMPSHSGQIPPRLGRGHQCVRQSIRAITR
jgi:hypothetical protein